MSEYIPSKGQHDPSGNIHNALGSWTPNDASYTVGAKHWEDLSGVNDTTGEKANHVINAPEIKSIGKIKSILII